MSDHISKQDLANVIEELERQYGRTNATVQLKNQLDLPPSRVKQTMIITLRIPVENMDPEGDTYSMGCDKIRSLINDVNYTRAQARLVGKIETVEIVPRKDNS